MVYVVPSSLLNYALLHLDLDENGLIASKNVQEVYLLVRTIRNHSLSQNTWIDMTLKIIMRD